MLGSGTRSTTKSSNSRCRKPTLLFSTANWLTDVYLECGGRAQRRRRFTSNVEVCTNPAEGSKPVSSLRSLPRHSIRVTVVVPESLREDRQSLRPSALRQCSLCHERER